MTKKSNFRIDTSNIPNSGLGAFAELPIKKGTFLGCYEGTLMNLNEFKKKYPDGNSYACLVYRDDDKYVIDPSKKYNWTRYMNCSMNYKNENVLRVKNNNCSVLFYAKRNIKRNEELLYHYGEDYAKYLNINYKKNS